MGSAVSLPCVHKIRTIPRLSGLINMMRAFAAHKQDAEWLSIALPIAHRSRTERLATQRLFGGEAFSA
jgi:hypothetical protein